MVMNILKCYQLKKKWLELFLVIDSSIHEKVKLREEFNISEEGKELRILKSLEEET